MIFAIGDANPRAPIGSSVHGGTEGSNPLPFTGESCANLTCTQTVLSVTYFEPVPLRVARAPRLPTHKPSMK